RARRRTVARPQSCDSAAHRYPAIHVFRRHEVLLPQSLLGEDGILISGARLHFFRTSQSPHRWRDPHDSTPEQARSRSFARTVGHCGNRGTNYRITVAVRNSPSKGFAQKVHDVGLSRCSGGVWRCEQIGIEHIPLLASPQGGVAERVTKYREASADREAGVVFRSKTKRKTTP